MDINKYNPISNINFNKPQTLQNFEDEKTLPELKQVQISAGEVQNNYGRAMINRSFKGANNTNSKPEVNISDFVDNLIKMDVSDEIVDDAKTKLNETQYNKIFSVLYDIIINEYGDLKNVGTLESDVLDNIQMYIKNATPWIVDLICNNFPDIDSNSFTEMLLSINETNQNLAEKLCTDKELDFPKNQILSILRRINDENLSFAERLCTDKELAFPKDKISNILTYITGDNIGLAQKLCFDKELSFPVDLLGGIDGILASSNAENISLAEKLCTDKELDFPKDMIGGWDGILACTNAENKSLAERLCTDKKLDFPKDMIGGYKGVLRLINQDNKDLANLMAEDENLSDYKNYIYDILYSTNAENISLAQKLCFDKELDFPKDMIGGLDGVLFYTNAENLKLAERLCTDKTLEFPVDELVGYYNILSQVNSVNRNLADIMADDENLIEYKDCIKDILHSANAENISLAERLCADKELDFPKNQIGGYLSILSYTNAENINIAMALCTDKSLAFPKDKLVSVLQKINKDNRKEIEAFIEQCRNGELPVNGIMPYFNNQISQRDLTQLTRLMGLEKIKSLSESDLNVACKLYGLYGKNDVNEIKMNNKKAILRALVECNTGMFGISEAMKKYFPLIPTSQEEYCDILPSLVRSLGIETNTLSSEKTQEFNASVFNLADSLINISDEEFSNMNIEQEYSKDDFIADTLDIVKNLEETERQKVYDYFGFELHHNRSNPTGFSILGYPVNLNNGQKLAKITNPVTKEVVEQLRPNVIRFSQNNHISCDNKNIEKYLNEVVTVFPELRTQIGKVQHNTHSFDVMKHSLKVMKKIVENTNYKFLNDSDKKLMLLASLFHDGNKTEAKRGGNHASESAFDAFYITKKLNLTREEQIKLYSLINNHEWLHYVNNGKNETDTQKRQQSVAFDLQYDNLFDMADILTDADLKSVKKDDSFFNKYKEAKKQHVSAIKNYIAELKKSQPLLPVTKLPKASIIDKAITHVNVDGSTNIKGVYKNDKGLVVIKYNEVEDWESIGFSKGTLSKGIMAKGVSGINTLNECDVNTGNIKFFVHGLDFSNQLSKFDAFALPDSDALLSVSYTERPESKYRFFRTQGVLLDVDTKYVHGGGNTDSGSGCGKDINNFKEKYIFGGERESDRVYVSDLIKEALNLSDEEYTDFVRENANKSMLEINPPETREKIIRALATINSNTRKGNREYNEMYVSNPNVMGVFAYKEDGNINNVLEFLNDTSDKNGFLQQYALEHDMPFVIFGD